METAWGCGGDKSWGLNTSSSAVREFSRSPDRPSLRLPTAESLLSTVAGIKERDRPLI